jgi:hypothetical protein
MGIEIKTIHLTVLLATALVILYSDHQGFEYVRGKKETLSRRTVTRSHRLVWLGLVLMIGTGIAMVLPAWEYWLSNPTFYVKMGFVLTLVINGLFIGKLSHTATERPFASLTREEKTVLLVSGVLSGAGWLGAATVGLFFL